MTTILRIDSGAAHEASISRSLTDEVIAQLANEHTTVVHRDVTAQVPPAVGADWVAATRGTTDGVGSNSALAHSDELIDELIAADVLVISAPVYNFSVPAALKLWIDQVSRAGRTFAYTEAGPQGLLQGKRAVVVVASGGMPIDSPIDFCTPYLRHLLGFLGISDVQVVAAERTAYDPGAALDTARGQIALLAA